MTTQPKPTADTIAADLARFIAPDQVTELRALHVGGGATITMTPTLAHLRTTPCASVYADFRAAILAAHPDDDTPRLVMADALDETGDEAAAAWARFIRLQCETLAWPKCFLPNDSCDCNPCRIQREAVRLMDSWWVAWWAACCDMGQTCKQLTWRRGLPYSASFEQVIPPLVHDVPKIVSSPIRYTPLSQIEYRIPSAYVREAWRFRIEIAKKPDNRFIRATVILSSSSRPSVELKGVRLHEDRSKIWRPISGTIRELFARREELFA